MSIGDIDTDTHHKKYCRYRYPYSIENVSDTMRIYLSDIFTDTVYYYKYTTPKT